MISKKHEDYWQWIDTWKQEFYCDETLIDEMIQHEKKQLEKGGRELLDVYVHTSKDRVLPFVTIECLSRPKP